MNGHARSRCYEFDVFLQVERACPFKMSISVLFLVVVPMWPPKICAYLHKYDAYMRICAHIRAHMTHICTYFDAFFFVCTHIFTYFFSYAHICTYMYKYACIFMYKYANGSFSYLCTCLNMRTNMYIYVHFFKKYVSYLCAYLLSFFCIFTHILANYAHIYEAYL